MALRGMAVAGLLSGPRHGMEASWGLAAVMRQIGASSNTVRRGVGRGAWDGDGPRMQHHRTREGQKATSCCLWRGAFRWRREKRCLLSRSGLTSGVDKAECWSGVSDRSYSQVVSLSLFFSSRETVTGRFAKPTRLCL
jgi:hypothetical protein